MAEKADQSIITNCLKFLAKKVGMTMYYLVGDTFCDLPLVCPLDCQLKARIVSFHLFCSWSILITHKKGVLSEKSTFGND